jgi:hypothetical protein
MRWKFDKISKIAHYKSAFVNVPEPCWSNKREKKLPVQCVSEENPGKMVNMMKSDEIKQTWPLQNGNYRNDDWAINRICQHNKCEGRTDRAWFPRRSTLHALPPLRAPSLFCITAPRSDPFWIVAPRSNQFQIRRSALHKKHEKSALRASTYFSLSAPRSSTPLPSPEWDIFRGRMRYCDPLSQWLDG